MLKEGAFENPKPDIAMGLHVVSTRQVGKLSYRGGASQAGGDNFRITIKGKQTHAAMPWRGVDPIVIGAQVVLALQTIPSRQVDVTTEPSVLTVGAFNGGNRPNIIPENVELEGTLRTFSLETRDFIVKRVTETAEAIAKSAGGEAKVEWFDADHVVPLINNVNLTRQLAASLQRVAGIENVFEIQRVMPYDDFAFFAQAVPGFYFNVGIASPGHSSGKSRTQSFPSLPS
jgi:amidohydrolase